MILHRDKSGYARCAVACQYVIKTKNIGGNNEENEAFRREVAVTRQNNRGTPPQECEALPAEALKGEMQQPV
jgi:hypothetical protein